jgi:hypothetical protein
MSAAGPAGSIEGVVTNHGLPVRSATVKFLRAGFAPSYSSESLAIAVATPRLLFGAAIEFPIDGPGMYRVKVNGKGHYVHFGLPPGTYSMAIEVNGSIIEEASGVVIGERRTEMNFEIGQ